MKKNLTRLLAIALVICMAMSYIAPVSFAAAQTVVYDFVQIPKSGGLYYGLGSTEAKAGQMARALQGGDWLKDLPCTLTIPERYALAEGEQYALNWTYEAASEGIRRTATDEAHLPGIDVRFQKTTGLRSVLRQDDWIAFRIKSPGEGTYAIDLTYYGYTGSGKTAFYILEAEGEASIAQADVLTRAENIQANMDPDNRVGMVNLYAGTANASNSAFIGNWTFQADKEYIVVMECYESAPFQDNSYVYLTNLTMTAGGKTPEAASAEERVRPLTVKENVITVADAGAMAAVWEVDGQDYYYLPIEGGQLLIFNLDTWELVKTVETGIGYPTSTAVVQWVDENGNTQTELFVGGNGKRMYGYNLYTGKGRFTAYYNNFTGLGGEQALRGIAAHNGKVYIGLSYEGHLAEYDPATNKYTDLGDMIQESFSEVEGEDGEVTEDATGGIGSIDCYGDYLYLTATSLNSKKVIKYDLVNKTKVTEVDVSKQIGPNTGTRGLTVLGDGDYLIAGGIGFQELLLIDLATMEIVGYDDAMALGLDDTAWEAGMNQMATDVVQTEDANGNKLYKQYFVAGGPVYAYNTQTERFEKIGGAFNGFNVAGKQSVTLSVNGGAEQLYLFAYAGGGQVRLCDPTVGKKISPENIMKPEYGTNGAALRINTAGEGEDANTLYLGAFNTPGCAAYDSATGTFTNYRTEGQTDSQVWYNGKLYAGNYSACIVYEIDMDNSDNNTAVISDMIGYEQKRIHTLTAGDGYVFAGTIPTTYIHGGGIGMYNTVTGEEDFIRFKETSVNGEKVVSNRELWDLSVKGLVYQNELLYGCTTRSGGSGSEYVEGTSAQIFVYDYKGKLGSQQFYTLDLRAYIPDYLPATDSIDFIGGITADPVVEGRFWGLVSDVLFTFAFNEDTKDWDVQVIHDRKHTEYKTTANRSTFNIPVVLDAQNNTVYVSFISEGIYRITLNDWNTAVEASSQRLNGVAPTFYAMGADNMLYYASGANLMAFPVNVTAEDWVAPQAWDAQVKAIGKVTLNSAAAIQAARTAYEALTLRDKCLVQNMAMLEEAEAQLLELLIAAEASALTSDSVEALESYIAQYDAMTARQKRYVKNYTVLTESYERAVEIKAAEDAQAAQVQAQINALNVTSLDDAQAVMDAREAYEALNDRQKALVDITALTAAEVRLATLVSAAEVQAQIDGLPDSATLEDEATVATVRAVYDALSDEVKAEVTTAKLDAAESQIGALHTLQEQIDALTEEVEITDISSVNVIRAAYEKLTDAQKTGIDITKLIAAENALSELKKNAVPTKQFYNFELYEDPIFYTGCTKYSYDENLGRIPTNINAGKGYNSTYATIANWFYASYPQTVNWGIETNVTGTVAKYEFRGASDQGLRMTDTLTEGTYSSVRIFVPAAGLYQIDLMAGDWVSTFSMYVIPANTLYVTERTSASALSAAMTAENQLLGKTQLKAETEMNAGQWNFPDAGDYIVIFKAEGDNAKGINFRNMTLTPVVNAETAVAKVGEEYFLSLNDAFAYQVENGAEAVLLNKNSEVGDVILPANAVLDLNGYTLTADSVLSYSSSAIIDSSEKDTGVLVTNDTDGNMISEDNAQLPIYDAVAGGYRFFEVSVASVAITGKTDPKYWFQVNIENFDELYKLIQAGSELNITAKMTWNGGQAQAVAGADFLQKWADAYTNNENIYITVTTVNAENFVDFSLMPCVVANGISICGDEMQ